jgi:hypothetical protein
MGIIVLVIALVVIVVGIVRLFRLISHLVQEPAHPVAPAPVVETKPDLSAAPAAAPVSAPGPTVPCPNCGHPVQVGAGFCPQCGKTI